MKKQRLELKKNQSLSAQQIQFLSLLQLPILNLERRIEEELEENPALEEDDERDEQISAFQTPSKKPNIEDAQLEDTSNSLVDHLSAQLIDLNLNKNILFLVQYLINSLDDHGFLNRDLYSISSDLLVNDKITVSEEEIQIAVNVLKNLDPIGVGAKNLQECLLIQLKKKHPNQKFGYKIIKEFYSPFSNKNFEYLIKSLKISERKLKEIYNIIETLNPIPGSGFSKSEPAIKYIYADFTITENQNRLQLQLNKGNTKALKISKYYSDLLSATSDLETKKFLDKKLEKAKWFKEAMEKRDVTLRLVLSAIMKIQEEYLKSGIDKDLKPMKLADVASLVNMDISTISRVSSSKFVETHFGTFKIKELFSDAYKKDDGKIISTVEIKTRLKEIIQQEDKKSPYTDEQLSELLGSDKYHIARRTVAKYREQLKIEVAKLRRKL